MNDLLSLAPVLVVGMALGAIFFGGLWWTVRHAASSRWVALWFFGSLVVRTLIVLAGFYVACGSDWRRWLAALLGFSVARLLVTRLTRSASLVPGDSHAP